METLVGWVLPNAAIATALALPAFLVQSRWKRPALAHALWVLVLLKLVTPPLWQVPMAWAVVSAGDLAPASPGGDVPVALPEGDWGDPESFEYILVDEDELAGSWPEEEQELEAGIEREEAAAIPPLAAIPWRPILSGAWLAGLMVWTVVVARNLFMLWGLLRRGGPADKATKERVEYWSSAMGLRSAPEVIAVEGAVSPMLWALGRRARLILPRELWVDLTCEQRDALLIHELAHYKRRDHWVRLLELVATGAFWWLPTVWWARRRLRAAEEQCCDAWVVSVLKGSERAYATALLDTLDFLARTPKADAPLLAASGMGQFHDLQGRISMILHGKSPRALSALGRAGVLGLSLAMLPAGLTFAQSEAESEGEGKEPAEVKFQLGKFDIVNVEGPEEGSEVIEFDDIDVIDEDSVEVNALEGVRVLNGGIVRVKVLTDEGKEEGEKEEKGKGEDRSKLSPEQVKEKEEQIKAARVQLKEAQAQLQKAAENLAKLESELGHRRAIVIRRFAEGRGPDGQRFELRGEGGREAGLRGRVIVAPRPPHPPVPPRPPIAPNREGIEDRVKAEFKGVEDRLKAQAEVADKRAEEADKRVEELAKLENKDEAAVKRAEEHARIAKVQAEEAHKRADKIARIAKERFEMDAQARKEIEGTIREAKEKAEVIIQDARKRTEEAGRAAREKGVEGRKQVEANRKDQFRAVPLEVRRLPEQDKRIRELEEKLDRVLKQLEEIKGKEEKKEDGKEKTTSLPFSVFSFAPVAAH